MYINKNIVSETYIFYTKKLDFLAVFYTEL